MNFNRSHQRAYTSAFAGFGPTYLQETALILSAQKEHRDKLRRYFLDADYHVLAAGSGKEAVELCRNYEGAIHILITDVDLPGAAGWKLAEEAVKMRPGMVVLFLGAECSPNEAKQHIGSEPVFSGKAIPPDVILQITRALSQRTDLAKRLN